MTTGAKTIAEITKYNQALSQNYVTVEDQLYTKYFPLRLAYALLQDYGSDAAIAAKCILAYSEDSDSYRSCR